jgi:cell division septation protein DedD
VGAFLEKANAEVLLQTLRKRGYTPYIYSIWDDMKRQWHTVRLGNYEDQESASKSAAEFTKKEKMPSSVRGVGVL